MRTALLPLLLLPIAISFSLQDPMIRQVLIRTASLPRPLVRQGKNFDMCKNTDECDGSRICISSEGQGSCQDGRTLCQCAPIANIFCNTSDTCDQGESCATILSSENSLCVSDTVIDKSGSPFTRVEDFTASPTISPPLESSTEEATTTEDISSIPVPSDTSTTDDDDEPEAEDEDCW